MSGGDEPVKIEPAEVQQTAQGVATQLDEAAEPGPVPAATGASPIDLAAGAAATTVIGYVAAGSADLAPRGGEVVGAAATAVGGLQSADSGNATNLSAVREQELPARPAAATAPLTQAAGQTPATTGIDQVQQAASSAASALGSPVSGLGSMSPGSALSSAPLSSLAGSPTQPANVSTTTQASPAEPPAHETSPAEST